MAGGCVKVSLVATVVLFCGVSLASAISLQGISAPWTNRQSSAAVDTFHSNSQPRFFKSLQLKENQNPFSLVAKAAQKAAAAAIDFEKVKSFGFPGVFYFEC